MDWREGDYDDVDGDDGWGDDFTLSTAKKRNKKSKSKPKAATAPTSAMKEEDLPTVVSEWRRVSRSAKSIDPFACQNVLTMVLAHLKCHYAHLFKRVNTTKTTPLVSRPRPDDEEKNTNTNTNTKKEARAYVELDKVELVFTAGGQEIQCQPGTGRVEFGLGAIKKEFYDGATSRYPLENDFMRKMCRTKEDVLMWFLLHEFTHLFEGCARHDHAFFGRVLSLARADPWLFSSHDHV